MSEELFDLYNENNESLGIVKPRSEVHRDGDWHRVVHIYVRNKAGQFLVHRRSPKKDLAANTWDTRFGGHIQAGHDYDETAVREIEEEIGLQVSINDLIVGGMRDYNGETNKEHAKFYFYNFNGDIKDLRFNDNEVMMVEWMSADEIRESMIHKTRDWAGSIEGFDSINSWYISHF